jgi:2-amino-4-hydroxy-6-hydroxymethyldihydropteridine diphosphokinase
VATTTYAIAIGSNRPGRHGDPDDEVRAALAAIGAVRASRVIRSAPLGPSIRRFANAAALVESALDPVAMLKRLKAVERDFGRRAGRRWGARVIDLDIVLWSGGRVATRRLTIPHRELQRRDFVLAPLVEIAPDWRDPARGSTMRQFHARLTRRVPLPS